MHDVRRQPGVIGASLQLGCLDCANGGGGQNGRRRSHEVYRAAAKVCLLEAESCISDGRALARLRRPPPDALRKAS
eukprot:2183485-Pyramimonas_sp.AAC.1